MLKFNIAPMNEHLNDQMQFELNEPLLDKEYETTGYRWVILVSYSLLMTSSAFCMMTFSPVSKVVGAVF